MSNLIGYIRNSPMISTLGWVDRFSQITMATLVLGLLLSACTITGVANDQTTPAALETAQDVVPTSVGENKIDKANPENSGLAQNSALDADAIVAAQEEVISGIYARLVPSVVRIRSIRQLDQIPNLPGSPGPPDFGRSSGSGFVWDDQGHIVTNHHVIEGADRMTVIFADNTELDATLLGSDPDSDLAVLQVEDSGYILPPVSLGDSSAVRVGNIAVAIGNPFGQEFTITSGIISAVGRTIRSGNSQFSIPQVIQTDAPINPGNSGGPLLDRQGRVIGVNTQIISNSGANSGIGFAVPINTAKRVIPGLIEAGRYEYAWLGISGTTLTGDTAELTGLPRNTRGTLIIEVAPGGPADTAGLHGSDSINTIDGLDFPVGGDVIIAIDGSPIGEIDQLISYLIENTNPGEEVAIEFFRDGPTRETLMVTLGKRPGF